MHDLRHADEGVEVEEDGEDHPGRLPEHLDLILLRLRVFQQETEKIKRSEFKTPQIPFAFGFESSRQNYKIL